MHGGPNFPLIEDPGGGLCKRLQDAYWGLGKWKAHTVTDQKGEDKKIRSYLFLLPRGTYKTTVATVGFSNWIVLQNDPPEMRGEGDLHRDLSPPSFNGKPGYDQRILLGHETHPMSKKYHLAIQRHFEKNEELIRIYGNLVPRRSSKLKWIEDESWVTWRRDMVAKEGTLTTTSFDHSMTGGHFDIGVIDDIVSDKRVTNDEQIEKTKEFYRKLIPIMDPNSILIFIGTRWDDKDLYGYFQMEEEGLWEIYTDKATRSDADVAMGKRKLFFPQELSVATLKTHYTRLGPYSYSCQYQNDPIDPDTAIFTREMFEGQEFKLVGRPGGPEMKDWLKDMHVYTSGDPAISKKKKGTCFAVILSCAWDHFGNCYLLDLFMRKPEFAQPTRYLNEFFRQIVLWNPKRAGIEEAGFQAVLRFEAEKMSRERGIFVPWFELETLNRSKSERIERLEPLCRSKKFWYQPQHAQLLDQFLRYPRGTYQDGLDCLAYQIDMLWQPRTPKRDIVKTPEEIRVMMNEEAGKARLRRLGIGEYAGSRKESKWYNP